MTRMAWLYLLAGFGLLIVIGMAVWGSSYDSWLVREWTKTQQAIAVLDATVTNGKSDFADIDKSVKDLKSRIDDLSATVSARSVPPFSRKKKYFFSDYLGKTSGLLASISINCSVWKAEELTRLEQAASAMRDAQTAAALVLGVTTSRPEAYSNTASTFNKMRQARKKVAAPKPQVVVVNGSLASIGFSMPTDPYLANYMSQMRSLLREYKSLRGGLDRYIAYVKDTGQSLEASAYTVEFKNAMARRESILNRMSSISAPAQYHSVHRDAIDVVTDAISAMQSLKDGDYPTFSRMSDKITPRLAAVMIAYGL